MPVPVRTYGSVPAAGVFRDRRVAEFQDLPGAGYPAVRSARDRSLHPRTRNVLGGIRPLGTPSGIATEPFGYLDVLSAMANASKILTNSGGMQREAHLLGVPCITLRDTTEWVETVEDGWNMLVGADRGRIGEAIGTFRPEKERGMIFGEAGASGRISALLRSSYDRGD